MADPELSKACAVVARKDVQPLRRALFAQLADRSPAVRLAKATFEGLGGGRAAAGFVGLLAIERFLEARFPARSADLVAIWKYENERRQIESLRALARDVAIEAITLERMTPATAPARDRLGPGWELIREHAARGDFLVAARVAETVGYYLRLLPWLENSRAPAVLVSSDANPYALALVHAARRTGKKTCFITHGHVAEGPPPLDFDLSLLDGPVLREVYERAGPVRGAITYKGSEGRARPMSTAGLRRGVRTLGVFLSILVSWPRVASVLERLRAELAPERIVLRLHPNPSMLDPRWRQHVRLERVEVSSGTRSILVDAEACDLVVAGNTSAHLSVLKLGVPSLYVTGLDEVGDDYYGFVREGIVAAPSGGVIDLPAVASFYERPEWPSRFARFDAGYPDRQGLCDREVAAALGALVGRSDRESSG